MACKTMTKALLLTAVVGATGCVTPGTATVTGGAAGAAVGAGVGASVGKSGKGAAVGAGVGALAGAALGNYLDRRARELSTVAETRQTDEGLLVNLDSNILFPVDSATLTPEAQEQLTRLGDILAKYPQDRLRVEGHTDSTGPLAYNDALSLRRAEAVARVLRERGVKEEQLARLGLGERQPVASNRTLTGRSENRRVELHIEVTPPQRG